MENKSFPDNIIRLRDFTMKNPVRTTELYCNYRQF